MAKALIGGQISLLRLIRRCTNFKTKVLCMKINVIRHFSMFSALVLALPVQASDTCEITSDTVRYYELREQAILLMQYGDVVVRAVDGAIRCNEDSANNRQVCRVEGKGTILTEGGDRAPHITTMKSDVLGEVHIYGGGDLSCGLALDFD